MRDIMNPPKYTFETYDEHAQAIKMLVNQFFGDAPFTYEAEYHDGLTITSPNGMATTLYYGNRIPRHVVYGVVVEWLLEVRESLEGEGGE